MARQATITLNVRASDAREEVAQLEKSLSEVEIEAVEAGEGFSRLSSEASEELAQTRAQTQRTAAAMDQMSTSAAGSANSLGIELTQAAQDASYGVSGVANQIPQLQLEFQRLRDQTGSTSGALSELGSAFIGPTGVLAAGTLLLQFWPQIVSAFSDAGDEAEEASEKVKGLAEATGSVVEVTSDQIQELELSLNQVDQSVATTESRIGTLQDRIDQLQGLQDFIQGAVFQDTDIPLEQIGTAVQAVERTSITFEQLRRAREQGIGDLQTLLQNRLETTREELDTERGVKKNLTEQQQELERQLRTQERLRELGAERSDTEDENADSAERQAEAYNALAVSAQQAAKNAQVVGRFMQQRDQMPMQRRINAFGVGRTPTIGGTMLNQGRSQWDLMLQAARDAGLISEFGTLQQTLGSVQQAAQDAGGDVEQNVNRELQRGVNLASQIGTTLIRSARRGGIEFEQVFGTILSAVGGTLSAIPGVGTIAGPILGGAGQLISAFDQGGMVDTPLQIVGESGPELAALPQGTRVSTARETERMLSQQVNVNVTGEIRRLRSRELGLVLREDETRREQFGYTT